MKELNQLSGMDLIIKRGDTRNAIVATLEKNGVKVDLSNCTVLFYMRGKVNGEHCQVLEDGRVMFPVEESLVDTPGIFYAEFKVRYPDGRIETFPNDCFLKIKVCEDLKEV